jgi:hypothetical protein
LTKREAVIRSRFFADDRGGKPNRWLSSKIKPLGLSAEEKPDLVAFLRALSGEVTWYGKQADARRASN